MARKKRSKKNVGPGERRPAVGPAGGGGDFAADGVIPVGGVGDAGLGIGRRIRQRAGLRGRGVVVALARGELDDVRCGVVVRLGLFEDRIVLDRTGLGVGGLARVVARVLGRLPAYAIVHGPAYASS